MPQNPEQSQSLDETMEEIKNAAARFKTYWIKQRKKNTEQFPLEIGAGEWFEQFVASIVSPQESPKQTAERKPRPNGKAERKAKEESNRPSMSASTATQCTRPSAECPTCQETNGRGTGTGQMGKPIHGEPIPKDVPADMQPNPPVPCDFRPGDNVVYKNDYGAEFVRVVKGFAKKPHSGNRFVYLNTSSWWFPVSAESLTQSA